jgi:hypothetical protein
MTTQTQTMTHTHLCPTCLTGVPCEGTLSDNPGGDHLDPICATGAVLCPRCAALELTEGRAHWGQAPAPTAVTSRDDLGAQIAVLETELSRLRTQLEESRREHMALRAALADLKAPPPAA